MHASSPTSTHASPAQRRRLPACLLGLLGVLACMPGAARADEVVLFRCTDANDGLTVQNKPCPAGSTQRIQRFAAPASTAAPLAASAPSAPPTDAAGAGVLQRAPLPVLQAEPQTSVEAEGNAILDSDVVRQQARQQAEAAQESAAADKPPLPEIYQCQGSDGARYLHEREPAPPHCVLMTISGLGGNTPINAAGCEVIRDRCEPIAEPLRCSSWQQRYRDARGSERFAAPENKAATTAERERLQAILADSDCAIPL